MTGVRWTEDQLADYERRRQSLGRVGLDADIVRGDTKLQTAIECPAAQHTPGGEGVENSPRQFKCKRRRPEQALQEEAVEFLDVALPPFWRVIHVPNGGWRSPIEAAIMAGQGVKPGFTDLILLGPGRYVVIELKADGRQGERDGGLSKTQVEWRDWFNGIGAPWYLCYTLDAVIAACHHAGIPLRVRAA